MHSVGIVEPESVLPMLTEDLPVMMLRRLLVMAAVISGSRLLICYKVLQGLDRISEAQLIELLSQVRESQWMGILLTTGSLRGVGRFADRVAVMFDGGVLESGETGAVLDNPRYSYTREFHACDPRITQSLSVLPTISREAVRQAERAVHESDQSQSVSF